MGSENVNSKWTVQCTLTYPIKVVCIQIHKVSYFYFKSIYSVRFQIQAATLPGAGPLENTLGTYWIPGTSKLHSDWPRRRERPGTHNSHSDWLELRTETSQNVFAGGKPRWEWRNADPEILCDRKRQNMQFLCDGKGPNYVIILPNRRAKNVILLSLFLYKNNDFFARCQNWTNLPKMGVSNPKFWLFIAFLLPNFGPKHGQIMWKIIFYVFTSNVRP